MALDLNNISSTLALKETTELKIVHPVSGTELFADDAKEQPIVAHLYGSASKKYRNKTLAMRNLSMKRKAKGTVVTAEMEDAEGIELLVSCTERFDNLTYNGQPLDNPETIKALYEDQKFSWLRNQIDAQLGDRVNFLTA